ncbi:MAG: polysaccharide deacetylase family protein [Bacteroidetes bacterium]|nr:polysaccharide deacetylase family protein [Bacteroidota bacterium]MCL5737888.1 polysaccharide deacetylase family protein [Bacteroidota bacterium]
MALSQLEVTGAEVYAVTIADMLVDRGHRVYIMSDTLTKPTKAQYVAVPFNKRNYVDRIRQIVFLIKFIKRNQIHVVHAHSRAAGWVSLFATRFCLIPMLTTAHGKRHLHLSSILIKALGDKVVAVCENVQDQLVGELKVKTGRVEILRNPIRISHLNVASKCEDDAEKPVAVIGRMSGPKGEVLRSVVKLLIDEFPNHKIAVIGSHTESLEVGRSRQNVEIIGHFEDAGDWMRRSAVVIASGRIAAEALMRKVPTVAVGEERAIGLVGEQNIEEALRSNFGDIAPTRDYDNQRIVEGMKAALDGYQVSDSVVARVEYEFDSARIFERIENIYQSEYVKRRKREIPVLMYHRVVRDRSEAGKHGIYVTATQFRKHLSYLKKNGYETITFKEFSLEKRFDGNSKKVLLTFDDGYEDNYTVMFPILAEFGFKATVFLVTGLVSNEWDHKVGDEPSVRLLSRSQVEEMQSHRIEFGSHGRTHCDLTMLSEGDLRHEITGSKVEPEDITGEGAVAFCYPYGRVNEKVKQAVRGAEYKFGVATDSGPIPMNEDLFQIRRIAIFPDTNRARFSRKVRGDYTFKQVRRYLKKNSAQVRNGF